MALEKILKSSSGVPTGEYERIAGGTLYADNPIGAIVPFGGTNIPAGFLLCNGSEVLKTDYAELYAVIGDAFGTPSVNTKFVLPDLREATTKGAGLTGKSSVHYDADGVALGEFIEDRIQNHIHRFSSDNSNVGTANCAREGGAVSQNRITPDSEVINARSGATTEVKAVGVNYIIKAKMVALPADLASGVEEYIDDNATSPVSASNKLVTENTDYTSASSNRVDISNYTSSNPYTAPSDGYLVAKADSTGNGARCRAVAEGAEVCAVQQVSSQSISQSMFVRKGMKLYRYEMTDQYCAVFFQPITVS